MALEVDCILCYKQLRAPRMLICGHNFCTECLENHVSNKSAAKCPTCGKQFSLPKGGVNELAINTALEVLLKDQAKVSELRNGASSLKCSLHNTAIAEFFCKRCCLPACSNCVKDGENGMHFGHKMIGIEQARDEEMSMLSGLRQRTQLDESMLEQQRIAIRASTEELKRQCVEVKSTIESSFKQLVNILLQAEDRLKSSVDEAMRREVARIEEPLDAINETFDRVRCVFLQINQTMEQDVLSMRERGEALRQELESIELLSSRKPSVAEQLTANEQVCAYLQQLTECARVLEIKATNHEYPFTAEVNAGTIVCVGGGAKEHCYNVAQAYSPQSRRTVTVASMANARKHAACVAMEDQLYVFGGCQSETSEQQQQKVLSTGETFDPAVNKWTSVKGMSTARRGHSLVLVGHDIYAIGGSDGKKPLSSVERFSNSKWFSAPCMNETREFVACCTLGSRIFAIGGSDSQNDRCTCETFSAESSKWTFVGALNEGRSRAAAVSWASNVYVIGGQSAESWHTDSIEEYEASTDCWTVLATRLTFGRNGCSAVLLANRIFVLGGLGEHGELSSAESFNPRCKQCVKEQNLLVAVCGASAAVVNTRMDTILNSVGSSHGFQKPEILVDSSATQLLL